MTTDTERESIKLDASYPQLANELNDNFQKFRLDLSHVLERLEHHLKGEWQVNGEWIPITEPYMNITGIGRVLSIVSAYVNENWLMSAPDSNEVNVIMLNLAMNLRDELILHQDEWEIRSVSMVKTMVCDLVWGTLLRARNGGERESISKIMKTVERAVVRAGKKLFGQGENEE